MAISSNGTGGGNWDVGASWVGGTAPGTGDDAIIVSGDTITLTQNETCGTCNIQSGGTIAGGGFELDCDTGGGANIFDHDGTITGVLDVLISAGAGSALDLSGTAGNVTNLTINATGIFTFDSSFSLDGSLVVSSGSFTQSNNADTIDVGANLVIDGTLGAAGWTGTISLAGDLSGSGTYTHGNQTLDLNGGAVTQNITFATTIYQLDINCDEATLNANTTIESALNISASEIVTVGAYTLTVGLAGSSGEIVNGGTFRMADGGKLYGANTGFYVDMWGTGVFDWDYAVAGTIYWKWLTHQGTDATAKTTGGAGVTVQFDGQCNFDEDFTFATNDTFDQNDMIIGIAKDLIISSTHNDGAELYLLSGGTGFFRTYTGTDLTIYTDSEYSFDGTNTFSGSVTWDGASVGDLLAYDATSVLNVTGGITVPSTAYFGADSSGDMGDNNDVTGWTADQSWGWVEVESGGFFTPPRADVTITTIKS